MSDWLMELAKHVNIQIAWMKMQSDGAGSNTYVNDMPPSPDNAVSFIRYGGAGADETFGNPLWKRNPRFQVTVRHPFSEVANSQSADDILPILSAIKDQTIGGINFFRVKPVSDVTELGPDSSNRQRSVINYSAEIGG